MSFATKIRMKRNMSCLPPGRLTIIRLDFLTTKIITKIRIFWPKNLPQLLCINLNSPGTVLDSSPNEALILVGPSCCSTSPPPRMIGPPFDGKPLRASIERRLPFYSPAWSFATASTLRFIDSKLHYTTVQRLAYDRIPPPQDAWNRQMVEGNNIRYTTRDCHLANSTIIPHHFSPKTNI